MKILDLIYLATVVPNSQRPDGESDQFFFRFPFVSVRGTHAKCRPAVAWLDNIADQCSLSLSQTGLRNVPNSSSWKTYVKVVQQYFVVNQDCKDTPKIPHIESSWH